MKRSIEKPPADVEQNLSMFEKPSRKKEAVLAVLAIAGGALAIADRVEAAEKLVSPAVSQSQDKNTIKLTPFNGDARRIPRHKEFLNAIQARNAILQRYNDDQYLLSPLPGLSAEDRNLYKTCVYGRARYIASYDQGVINTGRVNEDTVGIEIFSNDDCTKFRESNVVIGLETRDGASDEFAPANTVPGIIKGFASSPEYGTLYAGAFKMDGDYSCEANPDLQVRFTVENETRSDFLPVSIRTRQEKPQQIITC